MQAIITEIGNGLPARGDVVRGSDGALYEVGDSIGPINAGGPGDGAWERVELSRIGNECTRRVSECSVRLWEAS